MPPMSLFYQVFHSMSLQNNTYRITEVRFIWSQTLRTLLKAQALSKLEVPNHRPVDQHQAWVIWYRAAKIIRIRNKTLNLFSLCTFISRVFYFKKWPDRFPLFPALVPVAFFFMQLKAYKPILAKITNVAWELIYKAGKIQWWDSKRLQGCQQNENRIQKNIPRVLLKLWVLCSRWITRFKPVICGNRLSNEAMKPSKQLCHIVTKHPSLKEKTLEDFFKEKNVNTKDRSNYWRPQLHQMCLHGEHRS